MAYWVSLDEECQIEAGCRQRATLEVRTQRNERVARGCKRHAEELTERLVQSEAAERMEQHNSG